jgi:hypothetical protein
MSVFFHLTILIQDLARIMYRAFGKPLCTYKMCCKVKSTSICAGLKSFNFIRKNFLQIFVRKFSVHLQNCWKWCPRASIQGWTRLILFTNLFCRSAFGKSLCTYKRCCKWSPRTSVQAWIRLILFTNTFCRSSFGKFLCTYNCFGTDVHELLYRPELV